jgi:hypothetical protein
LDYVCRFSSLAKVQIHRRHLLIGTSSLLLAPSVSLQESLCFGSLESVNPMRLRFTIRDLLWLPLFVLLAMLCFRWCYLFLGSHWFPKFIPVLFFSALGFVFLGAGLVTLAIKPLPDRAILQLVGIGAAIAVAVRAVFSYIL